VRERAGADRRESVSTRAPQRDEVTNPDLALPPSATLSSVALGATHVFDWGSACGSASACQSLVGHALSIQVLSFNAAGGNRNSADDDAAITGLAERYQAGEAVMVVVRAWETPTMDVLDFLSAIRRVIESKATLCVAILDNQDSAQRGDVKTWQQTIGRLGDPWISTYPVPVTS
jgi:hypothetical protein